MLLVVRLAQDLLSLCASLCYAACQAAQKAASDPHFSLEQQMAAYKKVTATAARLHSSNTSRNQLFCAA